MMKILIVEDNLIFAKDLAKILSSYKCDVLPIARNGYEGIEFFTSLKPELVFIDIVLEGKIDGVEVAKYINKTQRVPFIYLTDFYGAGDKHFKKAVATRPSNYLPKGSFLPKQIGHFIETALYNFAQETNGDRPNESPGAFIQDHIFIPATGRQWNRLSYDDITYVEVEKPYCKIFVNEANRSYYLLRRSLDSILKDLPESLFLRIHQSVAVNKNYIRSFDAINSEIILTGYDPLKVGRTYKKQVLDFLDVLR